MEDIGIHDVDKQCNDSDLSYFWNKMCSLTLALKLTDLVFLPFIWDSVQI